MKIKFIPAAALAALSLFTACAGEQNENHADMTHETEMEHHEGMEHETAMDDTEKVSQTANSNLLSQLLDNYLALKNALVADNAEKAAEEAKVMLASFQDFPMNELTEEQHAEYMEIYENSKEQLEHISESPLDHQREHFVALSEDMTDLVKMLGTDRTLYQDYCPMYKNGSAWLSESKEIKNPYHGSKMLKCGKVQQTFN